MSIRDSHPNAMSPDGKYITTSAPAKEYPATPKTPPALPHKKEGFYNATINKEGKNSCPLCGAVELGESRIITHNYDCKNKGKTYYRIGGMKCHRQRKTKSKTRRQRKTKSKTKSNRKR